MIIEEQPMMVLRSLAVAIGLDEALVVQQMYWLLQNEGNGKELNGHRWLYNTYEQWQKTFFPFWSTRTLRRIFDGLEEMRLVESCQPEGVRSRRKWYRLNIGMIQKLRVDGPGMLKNLEPAKLATSSGTKRPLPLTEMSSQRSEEPKGSASDEAELEEEEIVPDWRPDKRSKKEKLRTLKNPRNIPSEEWVNRFISDNDLQGIENHRPDLYDRLADEKFHCWNASYSKWVPIFDWEAFLLGLNASIMKAKDRK